MLKYLRIAVTAWSLPACVRLVVLWVRSYWFVDGFWLSQSSLVYTCRGELVVLITVPYGDIEARFVSVRLNDEFDAVRDDAQRTWNIAVAHGEEKPGLRFIVVPFYTLLTVVILFGVFAAPWINWSQRFSLRTLLIATTLVAVVLGIVVAAR